MVQKVQKESPYEYIKSAYLKTKYAPTNPDVGLSILLSKWLSTDTNNLEWISKILPYMFYIKPLHFYYLLYFGVRKGYIPSKLTYIKTGKTELTEYYEKLRYVLNWSKKELQTNMALIEVALDKQDTAEKMGVEYGK